MTSPLENNPKIIGNYAFMRHEGGLYVLPINEYLKGKNMYDGYEYYFIDTFSELIEAFKYFKQQGLKITLDEFDFNTLIYGLSIDIDNLTHDEEIIYNKYINSHGRELGLGRPSMTKKLRMQVLTRDNYACKICGRTAKDGVKLEVDHIIPVSKGGTTTIDNLQTLCFDCNRGKSNKLL